MILMALARMAMVISIAISIATSSGMSLKS